MKSNELAFWNNYTQVASSQIKDKFPYKFNCPTMEETMF